MSEPPRRIALYGGSFDPVHPAHVAIAQAAVEQAGLDQVIFLPAAQSPLKAHGPEAPGRTRVSMLRAALTDYPWAEVSRWELERPGPSFSWQTVEHFQETAELDTKWFWLMGADQWDQLTRWQRWQHLAEMATFLVFNRSGTAPEPREGVQAFFPVGEFPGSSTNIRAALKEGRAWEELVHPDVAVIIRRENLYRLTRP